MTKVVARRLDHDRFQIVSRSSDQRYQLVIQMGCRELLDVVLMDTDTGNTWQPWKNPEWLETFYGLLSTTTTIRIDIQAFHHLQDKYFHATIGNVFKL